MQYPNQLPSILIAFNTTGSLAGPQVSVSHLGSLTLPFSPWPQVPVNCSARLRYHSTFIFHSSMLFT